MIDPPGRARAGSRAIGASDNSLSPEIACAVTVTRSIASEGSVGVAAASQTRVTTAFSFGPRRAPTQRLRDRRLPGSTIVAMSSSALATALGGPGFGVALAFSTSSAE